MLSSLVQFVYMAKGKDTMIQENMKEEIAESSGLQLGTAVDITGIKTTEMEVADLRSKNEEVGAAVCVCVVWELGTLYNYNNVSTFCQSCV